MTFYYEWAQIRTQVRVVIDWLKEDEPNIERCVEYLEKVLSD
jgi:hypothetical protein|tara:strand:- start:381 stop:506 length:126 start_codon:yes stop_codon:yes gene_type:complete